MICCANHGALGSRVELAEQHVSESLQRVTDQREILWWLAQGGEPSNLAWEILKQFEEKLDLRRQHLHRLRTST